MAEEINLSLDDIIKQREHMRGEFHPYNNMRRRTFHTPNGLRNSWKRNSRRGPQNRRTKPNKHWLTNSTLCLLDQIEDRCMSAPLEYTSEDKFYIYLDPLIQKHIRSLMATQAERIGSLCTDPPNCHPTPHETGIPMNLRFSQLIANKEVLSIQVEDQD